MEEYEKLLNIAGTGIMGYVQISAIGVNLPIYHSVDESILQVAIGHVPGSSLPVGGERTHAVLSGHRGLPSARLFTDLDQMVEGDTFTINIMDTTITYMVDQIRIVLPEEVDDLAIQAGRDYCRRGRGGIGGDAHTELCGNPRHRNSHALYFAVFHADLLPCAETSKEQGGNSGRAEKGKQRIIEYETRRHGKNPAAFLLHF